MNPPDDLSPQQLIELLKLAGIDQLGQAVLVKPHNHVWKLTTDNWASVPYGCGCVAALALVGAGNAT